MLDSALNKMGCSRKTLKANLGLFLPRVFPLATRFSVGEWAGNPEASGPDCTCSEPGATSVASSLQLFPSLVGIVNGEDERESCHLASWCFLSTVSFFFN